MYASTTQPYTVSGTHYRYMYCFIIMYKDIDMLYKLYDVSDASSLINTVLFSALNLDTRLKTLNRWNLESHAYYRSTQLGKLNLFLS